MSKGGSPNVSLSTMISPESELFSFISFDINSSLDYSSKFRALDNTNNADNGTKQENESQSHFSTSYLLPFFQNNIKANHTYMYYIGSDKQLTISYKGHGYAETNVC